MWLAVARSIRRIDPDSTITTGAAPGWEPDLVGVHVLPTIHQTARRVSRTPRSRAHAAAYLALNRGSLERGLRRCEELRSGVPTRPGLERSWEQEIQGARALIFAGAGGLTDAHALHAVAGWGMLVALASRHRVPVAFLGHGVGPLVRSDIHRTLARSLDHVSLFTTRDHASAELVASLNPDVNVVAAPDWAILLEVDPEHRASAEAIVDNLIGNEPYIALSLRRYGAAASGLERMVDQLVPRIVQAAADHHCQVLLVPTNIGGGRTTGDISHMAEVRLALPDALRQRCHVVEKRASAPVIRSLLAGAVGVFANRYHAIVFALAEGTPATGIAADAYYRAKMGGALEWYGEQDRTIEDLDGGDAGFLGAGIDLGGASRPARLQRTQELATLCEQPFVEWMKSLP